MDAVPWISVSCRRSFIDGRKMSLLGWMAGGLSSSQTMLLKSSGQVFHEQIFGAVEREDEVVLGKMGKSSCSTDCTHCGKQGFGGDNRKVVVAVPRTILWSHWATSPTQMASNFFTFQESTHIQTGNLWMVCTDSGLGCARDYSYNSIKQKTECQCPDPQFCFSHEPRCSLPARKTK